MRRSPVTEDTAMLSGVKRSIVRISVSRTNIQVYTGSAMLGHAAQELDRSAGLRRSVFEAYALAPAAGTAGWGMAAVFVLVNACSNPSRNEKNTSTA
jgi:hypothetical protein